MTDDEKAGSIAKTLTLRCVDVEAADEYDGVSEDWRCLVVSVVSEPDGVVVSVNGL